MFLAKLQNNTEKSGFAGAAFMDLSKAFDSMNHCLPNTRFYA